VCAVSARRLTNSTSRNSRASFAAGLAAAILLFLRTPGRTCPPAALLKMPEGVIEAFPRGWAGHARSYGPGSRTW